MDEYCTNCGAELPEVADFCPNCGHAVSQEEQAPAPEQQEPPQAVPPEAATTRQQVAFQPLAAAATGAGAQPSSTRGCILGGLAAAAVLGFLVLVVVGGALLYFLVIARSGSSDELLSERPTPQLSPGQDSLKDLVPQQVGDFTLHSKLQEFTGALQAGATQGVFMDYANSEGRTITHHLALFPSYKAADQWMRKDVEEWVSDADLQKVKEVALKGEQGQRIGTAILLRGKLFGKPVEVVEWTNGNLFADAQALPGEHAVEFFNVPPPY